MRALLFLCVLLSGCELVTPVGSSVAYVGDGGVQAHDFGPGPRLQPLFVQGYWTGWYRDQAYDTNCQFVATGAATYTCLPGTPRPVYWYLDDRCEIPMWEEPRSGPRTIWVVFYKPYGQQPRYDSRDVYYVAKSAPVADTVVAWLAGGGRPFRRGLAVDGQSEEGVPCYPTDTTDLFRFDTRMRYMRVKDNTLLDVNVFMTGAPTTTP